MLEKIVALVTGVAMLLLAIVMQSTTPASAGPIGIILVFALIYVSVLGVLTFFLFFVANSIQKVRYRHIGESAYMTKGLGIKRAYYYASVLAVAPVLLLAAQSVGRASVKDTALDVALVIVFEVIACIYVAKRKL